jgi:hypothetical protein
MQENQLLLHLSLLLLVQLRNQKVLVLKQQLA